MTDLNRRILRQKNLAMEYALAYDKLGDVHSRKAWTDVASLLGEVLSERCEKSDAENFLSIAPRTFKPRVIA